MDKKNTSALKGSTKSCDEETFTLEEQKEGATNKQGALRMLYLIHALHGGPKKIKELAEIIEDRGLDRVSERTIQRDMAALDNHFGVFKHEEGELKGKWAIDTTDFDTLFEIEDAVALALMVAKTQLEYTAPDNILRSLKRLFNKAERQLNTRESKSTHWMKRVKVAPLSHQLQAPELDHEISDRLLQLAMQQSAIRISYFRFPGDPVKTYTVTALSIFFRSTVPYLICRDHDSGTIRQLPFSRILEVAETVTTESRVEDFNLDDYEKSGALGFRYGDPFEIELEIFMSVMREVQDAPIGENQRIVPVEGSSNTFKLTATVPYNLNFIQWLMARAPYLKVMGPSHFKDKFHEELRRAYANASSDQLDVPEARNFKA